MIGAKASCSLGLSCAIFTRNSAAMPAERASFISARSGHVTDSCSTGTPTSKKTP